jgi:hypothetical protein
LGGEASNKPRSWAQNDPVMRLAAALGPDGLWAVVLLAVPVALVVAIWRPALLLDGALPLTAPDAIARLAWCLIGIPVALYAYAWLPEALTTIVRDIEGGGLIDAQHAEAAVRQKAGQEDIERAVTDDRWAIAGVLVMVGFVTLDVLISVAAGGGAERLQRALETLIAAPFAYLGTVIVLRSVAGLSAADRFLRGLPARVHPLHADGAGGWGHSATARSRWSGSRPCTAWSRSSSTRRRVRRSQPADVAGVGPRSQGSCSSRRWSCPRPLARTARWPPRGRPSSRRSRTPSPGPRPPASPQRPSRTRRSGSGPRPTTSASSAGG